jgi:flagellin-like protein
MGASDRGQSAVIGEVLLVGVVVVLAVTITVVAVGFGDEVREPAPVVGQSSGEVLAFEDGSDEQYVRITHEAGDPIAAEDIEIAVDAREACGKTGRIVDLPAKELDDEHLRGDTDMFDQSGDGLRGALETDRLAAGDRIEFRLKKGGCELDPGEQVTVRVVHTPSGAVVIEETLTAG